MTKYSYGFALAVANLVMGLININIVWFSLSYIFVSGLLFMKLKTDKSEKELIK